MVGMSGKIQIHRIDCTIPLQHNPRERYRASCICPFSRPTMPSIGLIQFTRTCCELAPGLLLTSSKSFISSSRHKGLRVNGSRHTQEITEQPCALLKNDNYTIVQDLIKITD